MAFQRLDVLADAGLAHVQTAGGFGEAQRIGRHEEDVQLMGIQHGWRPV